jgi:hypothetical protein
MRVRILSGSQRGALLDLPDAEAAQNVSSGFAELVAEVPFVPLGTIPTSTSSVGMLAVSVPATRPAPHVKAVKAPPKPAKKAARRRA